MSSGHPSRFYGIALGKERNFESTTDGLIAEAVTGVNVETKGLFYTNNTTTTVLSNLYNGVEGQIVTIVMLDSVTTIGKSSTYIVSEDTAHLVEGRTVTLLNHNSKWYGLTNETTPETTNTLETLTIANNVSSLNIEMNHKIVLIKCTSGGITQSVFKSISGGYVGQQVWIMSGSAGKTVKFLAGENIMLGALTAAIVVEDSAMVALIKGANGLWYAPTQLAVA